MTPEPAARSAVPRILDLAGDELAELRGGDLAAAIRAAEGRTVLAELVAPAAPLLAGTSNAELLAAFGADLLCLNLVDLSATGPVVSGLDGLEPAPEGLAGLARLVGRPVGLNLEPDLPSVPAALRATPDGVAAAADAGAAFAVVTANPGRGARIADLADAARAVRAEAPDLLCLAGKMHQAGADEPLGPDVAARLVDAGAHGVLVPLPGTVPGLDERTAAAMAQRARGSGALAVGTVGTSQEGAHVDTLRMLGLAAKRVGVDVHHIGDAGWTGLAPPENVYAYAVTIRGVRHTWNRMARSTRVRWQGRSERR